MAKINATHVILAVAVIAGLYIVAGGNLPDLGDDTPQANIGQNNNNGGSGTTVVPTTGLTAGEQLTVTMNNRDALTEDSVTEGTNVKTTLYNKVAGGGYNVVTTGSGNTYTLKQPDNGLVSVGFDAQASGQSYAFAAERTRQANSGIMHECEYVDPVLDGNELWICEFSTAHLADQVSLSGTKPDLSINAKYYNENTITLNSPSDLSSVGTDAGTVKFIEWEATGTQGDATFISTVELQINSTTLNKWSEGDSYLTVGGQQYSLSSLERSQDGTNTHYYLRFGNTQETAKIIEFANTLNPKDDMTAKMEFNLAASDVLTHTLKIDTVDETDGANSQVTDAVDVSA